MTEEDRAWNWLGEDVALAAHDAMLAEFGGLEGMRDLNARQSALARPRNLAVYGAPDAPALAAAYAYGIAHEHPFSDGNKRTGYALAIVFLLDSGLLFIGGDVESVEIMLAVADGAMSEDDLAAWFRERVRPL